jgi:predicted metal-dependent phosphoesterase TrpH
MGKADLHIHSSYSHDSTSSISAIFDWVTTATDLDVIAITDHDRIEGALEAQSLAGKYGIEVIPGIEISTAEGHLLALFIERAIPAKRPMLETILRVADQGGICVAAHPMSFGVHGANTHTILSVLSHPVAAKTMIGLETCNSGLVLQSSNIRAHNLACNLNLAKAGGSDSHLFWTIGSGYTLFPGSTAQDLHKALIDRTTSTGQEKERHSPGYYARHIVHLGMRRLGWVTWSPEPSTGLVLRRLSEI